MLPGLTNEVIPGKINVVHFFALPLIKSRKKGNRFYVALEYTDPYCGVRRVYTSEEIDREVALTLMQIMASTSKPDHVRYVTNGWTWFLNDVPLGGVNLTGGNDAD